MIIIRLFALQISLKIIGLSFASKVPHIEGLERITRSKTLFFFLARIANS